MSVVTVVDTDCATLWYHPDAGIVHHRFKKYTYGPELCALLTAGAEVLEQYSATKWLSDDRCNCALLPEDSDWADAYWAPRALAAGWKYWAIVLPEGHVGQLNMERFIARLPSPGCRAALAAPLRPRSSWARFPGR